MVRNRGPVRWVATGAAMSSRRTQQRSWRCLHARRDMTLVELQAELAGQGLRFGYGTLWRFFARHDYTRKKRQRTPASRSAPMS